MNIRHCGASLSQDGLVRWLGTKLHWYFSSMTDRLMESTHCSHASALIFCWYAVKQIFKSTTWVAGLTTLMIPNHRKHSQRGRTLVRPTCDTQTRSSFKFVQRKINKVSVLNGFELIISWRSTGNDNLKKSPTDQLFSMIHDHTVREDEDKVSPCIMSSGVPVEDTPSAENALEVKRALDRSNNNLRAGWSVTALHHWIVKVAWS